MANQHRPDHGDSRKGMESRAYRSWSAMKNRCLCVTSTNFNNYGGRGIKVCERWKSYEFFLEDMGCRPEGKTLDRVDVNGDYEPGNCRWATPKEQMDNQRRTWKISCFGKTGTVADWAKETGLGQETIRRRIREGVSPEIALTAKPIKGFRRTKLASEGVSNV